MEGLTKEEELRSKILKSDAIHKLGRHQEALEIIEDILKKNKKLDYPLIQVDALLIQADAYDMIDPDIDKIKLILDNAKKIVSNIKNLHEKIIAERKTRLFQREAQILYERLNDTTKSIDIHKQGLELAKKSGNKQLIARVLTYLSNIYLIDKNNQKKAKKLLEEAEVTAKSIGNKFELALIHFLTGIAYFRKRELKNAIKSYEKCIKLQNEIGSTYWLHVYNPLGMVYSNLGELDKSLDCYKIALGLLKERVISSTITLTNIGYTYYLKNEFDKALEYYMKSLALAEEKYVRFLPYILGSLIELFVEMNNLDLAKRYLTRLEKIRKKYNLEERGLWFLYSSILVLKASSKMHDWIKAADLIDEFLALEFLSPWFRYTVLFFLIEIRFKELQLSADPAVLEEVKIEIINLQKEAEEKQFFEILVNTYRLQSQLALIELNAKEAVTLLTKAHNLAKEKSLKRLIQYILKEQEKLNKQIGMWEKLRKEDAPLVEILKQVPLEKTLKEITKETSIELRDEKSGEIIEYRKLFALKI
ncbi:MAG: tetratricopeptide repeat protein [Asgard group archaeon]|nr:tetratricopeptide repeat protein [Asgard group archaeon]